jgi:ketosteroid isomerase-like protein
MIGPVKNQETNMRITNPPRPGLGTALAALICLLLLISAPLSAADSDPNDPAAVVQEFNAAITAGDIDTALEKLAEGSVQFQLRAVHPGMSDNPPLTADLRVTWQTVGAIVFPMSDVYERVATVTAVEADGDVATVWADTTTHTVRKGKAEPMDLAFSEVYLLVKKQDGWKIAGIADNRKPDTIRVDGSE